MRSGERLEMDLVLNIIILVYLVLFLIVIGVSG